MKRQLKKITENQWTSKNIEWTGMKLKQIKDNLKMAQNNAKSAKRQYIETKSAMHNSF